MIHNTADGNHWRVPCWSLNHAHIVVYLMSERCGCLIIGSVRLQVECPQQPSMREHALRELVKYANLANEPCSLEEGV